MKRLQTWPGNRNGETAKQPRLGKTRCNLERSPLPDSTAAKPEAHHSPRRFTHEPLIDAKNEIRLLQMIPGGDSDGDCLHFSIRTEVLHKTPDFIAISYTWGAETSPQTITVDGNEYSVRQNCHYVLRQTYRQWKWGMLQSDLVWIDSICVNQKDDAEKASQVSIMGQIYSEAGLVLACVGPHADDSEFFVEKARDIADLKYNCTHADFLCQDCLLPWEEWALALDIEPLSRLCRACMEFGGRVYWTRIWIIQEVAKATSLSILCGDDMLPWTAIHSLEDFLSMEMDMIPSMFDTYGQLPTVESNRMHDVFLAKEKTVSIGEVFSQFSSFSCTDLRDHLYGLLSLIKWPQHVEPILPDYGTSMFDVAVRVQPYLSLQQTPQMLETFSITSRDEHVQSLVGQRRKEKPSEHVAGAASATRGFKAMHTSDEGEVDSRALCGRIELAENGDLTATLVKKALHGFRMPLSPSASTSSAGYLSQDMSDSEEEGDLDSDIASLLSSVSPEQRPRAIMLRSEVAGIVCHDAREGDVLVPLLDRRSEVYIILRQNDEDVYDIIGQGVFRHGYQVGCEPGAYDDATTTSVLKAQVELNITAEEAVLLFAQGRLDLSVDDLPNCHDILNDTGLSWGQEDSWGRVLTSVSAELSRAARVTMQTPMLAKDVVVANKPFDQHEAYMVKERVRDADSSVAGQHSTWVVGRDSGA